MVGGHLLARYSLEELFFLASNELDRLLAVDLSRRDYYDYYIE